MTATSARVTQLLGEIVSIADDQHFANQTTAGRAGEDERGQNRHHDRHGIRINAGERHVEYTAEKGNLDDETEYGTVHVHSTAHGEYQIADVLRHAYVVAGLLVRRNGGCGAIQLHRQPFWNTYR